MNEQIEKLRDERDALKGKIATLEQRARADASAMKTGVMPKGFGELSTEMTFSRARFEGLTEQLQAAVTTEIARLDGVIARHEEAVLIPVKSDYLTLNFQATQLHALGERLESFIDPKFGREFDAARAAYTKEDIEDQRLRAERTELRQLAESLDTLRGHSDAQSASVKEF